MGRPGGLSNKPPAEVGNLILGKEDTLFGRPSDPGKDISRDLVCNRSRLKFSWLQSLLIVS